jgi:putative PIN family toxin of toxin-antitoxin system
MKVERTLPACYAQVVVDTNVLISAALSPDGAPARLLRRLHRESRLVFAPATFDELRTRLWLPKFDRYASIESRRRFLSNTRESARWHEVPASLNAQTWCRDPNDDKFIALALAAKATWLITGDDDLLCLDPLGELRILTPRAALDEITGAGAP